MPCLLIFANSLCWRSMSDDAMHCSASPKLCESTSPALWSETHCVASRMSESLFDFATTRTMFAFGATACDHSTSSDVSPAHPAALTGSVESMPNGATTWKLGGAGRPQVLSNNARSALIVGLPYASTIAIVRPLPFRPWSSSGWMPYAARI